MKMFRRKSKESYLKITGMLANFIYKLCGKSQIKGDEIGAIL